MKGSSALDAFDRIAEWSMIEKRLLVAFEGKLKAEKINGGGQRVSLRNI